MKKLFLTLVAAAMLMVTAQAHPSPMQITSKAAIDAVLQELQDAKKSGCEVFVGSHGSAATIAEVDFQIAYLTTLKELIAKNTTVEAFTKALNAAYPNLAGTENVAEMASKLYQK